MLIGYGDKCTSQAEIIEIFSQKDPDLLRISQRTVSKIHCQFREVGHAKDKENKPDYLEDEIELKIFTC